MSMRGAMVGGSVMAFVPGLTAQAQDDIMSSVALAQSRASETYDRLREPIDWFDHFTYSLTTLGWAVDEVLLEADAPQKTEYDSLEEAALHPLVTLNSALLLTAIKRSIRALRLDAFAQRIFESYSGTGKLAFFQFVPCEHRQGKGSYMYVSTMHVTTRSSVKRLFFKERISADALNVQIGWSGFYLKHEDFAEHRESVLQQLRGIGSDYIRDLDI